MALTRDQVKYVAKLANLPITSEEEEKYFGQLSRILDYIEQLNRADTSKVEAAFNVSGQENVMREDIAEICLTQEEAISNASKKQDEFFVTKGVFED